MKNTKSYVLAIFLFYFFSHVFVPTASAQNWIWGRQSNSTPIPNAGITAGGNGVDAWAVATDANGNIYAGGTQYVDSTSVTFGSVTVPASNTVDFNRAVWVKYNASGTALWASGTSSGRSWISKITTDASDNLIVFGGFLDSSIQVGPFVLTNSGLNSINYFLAKISPTGTVLWAVNDGYSEGGYGKFNTGGVTTDSAGNIYITSSFGDDSINIGPYTLVNNGYVDFFVAKYTPAGAVVWATSVGGTFGDYSTDIAVSTAGYIYVSGMSHSTSINFGPLLISGVNAPKALICKFSSSGVPLWAEFGGETINAGASALAKDNSGNIYLTGAFAYDSITLGGTTIRRHDMLSIPAIHSIFIAQYSPADTIVWAKTIEAPIQTLQSYALAFSPCGQIWVEAAQPEEIFINASDTLAAIAGPDPVFIAGFDLSGNVVAYAHLSSGGDDNAGLACDASGNVFLCSDIACTSTYPTVSIGPDVLTCDTVYNDETEELYLAKYGKIIDTTYSSTDTGFCNTTTGVTLSAPAGYTAYSWDNGASSPTRTITLSGLYYVCCFGCGATLIDTFNIAISGTTQTTYKDTTICLPPGDTILSAPPGYNSLLWSTGDTSASITVNANGSYWVIASKLCAVLVDTFKLKAADIAFSLGDDTSSCVPILLRAPSFADTHIWQDGSTGTTYSADSTGVYYLSISSEGCTYSDTISIYITDVSQHLHDTTLCKEHPIQFNVEANVPPGGSVLWSDGSKLNKLYIKDTGTYWLTVSDSLCTASDTFIVATEFCDCSTYIPNAFTPNSDGRNDFFRPVMEPGCPISSYWFAIYNRWGQQVFFSEKPGEGWSGHFNGAYCEVDTYEWLLKYAGGVKNTKHIMKGDVTLVR